MKLRLCVLLGSRDGGAVEYGGYGLDAYIAMIPKADGDSTHLEHRPLCVLPVVERLWASLWLAHLKDWVKGWVPESVFCLGSNGVSSVVCFQRW